MNSNVTNSNPINSTAYHAQLKKLSGTGFSGFFSGRLTVEDGKLTTQNLLITLRDKIINWIKGVKDLPSQDLKEKTVEFLKEGIERENPCITDKDCQIIRALAERAGITLPKENKTTSSVNDLIKSLANEVFNKSVKESDSNKEPTNLEGKTFAQQSGNKETTQLFLEKTSINQEKEEENLSKEKENPIQEETSVPTKEENKLPTIEEQQPNVPVSNQKPLKELTVEDTQEENVSEQEDLENQEFTGQEREKQEPQKILQRLEVTPATLSLSQPQVFKVPPKPQESRIIQIPKSSPPPSSSPVLEKVSEDNETLQKQDVIEKEEEKIIPEAENKITQDSLKGRVTEITKTPETQVKQGSLQGRLGKIAKVVIPIIAFAGVFAWIYFNRSSTPVDTTNLGPNTPESTGITPVKTDIPNRETLTTPRLIDYTPPPKMNEEDLKRYHTYLEQSLFGQQIKPETGSTALTLSPGSIFDPSRDYLKNEKSLQEWKTISVYSTKSSDDRTALITAPLSIDRTSTYPHRFRTAVSFEELATLLNLPKNESVPETPKIQTELPQETIVQSEQNTEEPLPYPTSWTSSTPPQAQEKETTTKPNESSQAGKTPPSIANTNETYDNSTLIKPPSWGEGKQEPTSEGSANEELTPPTTNSGISSQTSTSEPPKNSSPYTAGKIVGLLGGLVTLGLGGLGVWLYGKKGAESKSVNQNKTDPNLPPSGYDLQQKSLIEFFVPNNNTNNSVELDTSINTTKEEAPQIVKDLPTKKQLSMNPNYLIKYLKKTIPLLAKENQKNNFEYITDLLNELKDNYFKLLHDKVINFENKEIKIIDLINENIEKTKNFITENEYNGNNESFSELCNQVIKSLQAIHNNSTVVLGTYYPDITDALDLFGSNLNEYETENMIEDTKNMLNNVASRIDSLKEEVNIRITSLENISKLKLNKSETIYQIRVELKKFIIYACSKEMAEKTQPLPTSKWFIDTFESSSLLNDEESIKKLNNYIDDWKKNSNKLCHLLLLNTIKDISSHLKKTDNIKSELKDTLAKTMVNVAEFLFLNRFEKKFTINEAQVINVVVECCMDHFENGECQQFLRDRLGAISNYPNGATTLAIRCGTYKTDIENDNQSAEFIFNEIVKNFQGDKYIKELENLAVQCAKHDTPLCQNILLNIFNFLKYKFTTWRSDSRVSASYQVSFNPYQFPTNFMLACAGSPHKGCQDVITNAFKEFTTQVFANNNIYNLNELHSLVLKCAEQNAEAHQNCIIEICKEYSSRNYSVYLTELTEKCIMCPSYSGCKYVIENGALLLAEKANYYSALSFVLQLEKAGIDTKNQKLALAIHIKNNEQNWKSKRHEFYKKKEIFELYEELMSHKTSESSNQTQTTQKKLSKNKK